MRRTCEVDGRLCYLDEDDTISDVKKKMGVPLDDTIVDVSFSMARGCKGSEKPKEGSKYRSIPVTEQGC
jgi:hypothetical protein